MKPHRVRQIPIYPTKIANKCSPRLGDMSSRKDSHRLIDIITKRRHAGESAAHYTLQKSPSSCSSWPFIIEMGFRWGSRPHVRGRVLLRHILTFHFSKPALGSLFCVRVIRGCSCRWRRWFTSNLMNLRHELIGGRPTTDDDGVFEVLGHWFWQQF